MVSGEAISTVGRPAWRGPLQPRAEVAARAGLATPPAGQFAPAADRSGWAMCRTSCRGGKGTTKDRPGRPGRPPSRESQQAAPLEDLATSKVCSAEGGRSECRLIGLLSYKLWWCSIGFTRCGDERSGRRMFETSLVASREPGAVPTGHRPVARRTGQLVQCADGVVHVPRRGMARHRRSPASNGSASCLCSS